MKLINKKRWLILGTVTALSAPITMATFLSTGGNTKQFVFDGRVFNNENEALHYLMQYKKAKTNEVSVVGNINKSYANAETGLLNKSLLPNFNADDFSFYYFNAGGGINTNYEKAKNTYYNKGRIRTMYIDGFGNTFLSEAQAKRSMENYKMHQMIPYYKVDYYDDKNPYSVYMNPFNEEDVAAFKNNIKNNIESIVADNLNDAKPLYKIKVINDKTNNQSIPQNLSMVLDWKDIFKTAIEKSKKLDKSKFNVFYDGNTMSINSKSQNVIQSKLHSGWFKIEGHYGNNTTFTYDYYRDHKGNTMKMRIRNYSETKSDWIGFEKFKYDMDVDQITDIINGWTKVYLRSENNKKDLKDDIEQTRKPIDDYYDQIVQSIKNQFSGDDFLDLFNESMQTKIVKNFKNPVFKKIIIDQLEANFKSKLNNIIRMRMQNSKPVINISSNAKYQLTSMPTFKLKYKQTFWLKENMAQILNRYYDFGYSTKVNYMLPSDPEENTIELTSQNNPLLNGILESSKDKKDKNSELNLQIMKDDLPLFNVKASVNPSDGSITATSIEVSNENHTYQGVNKAFDKKDANGETSFYQYYLNLYNQLYENENDQMVARYSEAKKIAGIFKKYFEDDKKQQTSPKDSNWLYRENLSKNDTAIDISKIFKMFLTTIFDAYYKYKDNSNYSIFSMIMKKIPNPKNILIGWSENYQGNPTNKPYLSKYILRTISGFNAKISEGVYSSIDKTSNSSYSLATTENNWNNLVNKPSKDLPAQILVAYDNNGQQINVGNYLYDNESIMEFNIKLRLDPRRDYDHLSYKGKDELENEISKIYELDFKNNKLYFDKFSSLKRYLLKYIRDNSYNL